MDKMPGVPFFRLSLDIFRIMGPAVRQGRRKINLKSHLAVLLHGNL